MSYGLITVIGNLISEIVLHDQRSRHSLASWKKVFFLLRTAGVTQRELNLNQRITSLVDGAFRRFISSQLQSDTPDAREVFSGLLQYYKYSPQFYRSSVEALKFWTLLTQAAREEILGRFPAFAGRQFFARDRDLVVWQLRLNVLEAAANDYLEAKLAAEVKGPIPTKPYTAQTINEINPESLRSNRNIVAALKLVVLCRHLNLRERPQAATLRDYQAVINFAHQAQREAQLRGQRGFWVSTKLGSALHQVLNAVDPTGHVLIPETPGERPHSKRRHASTQRGRARQLQWVKPLGLEEVPALHAIASQVERKESTRGQKIRHWMEQNPIYTAFITVLLLGAAAGAVLTGFGIIPLVLGGIAALGIGGTVASMVLELGVTAAAILITFFAIKRPLITSAQVKATEGPALLPVDPVLQVSINPLAAGRPTAVAVEAVAAKRVPVPSGAVAVDGASSARPGLVVPLMSPAPGAIAAPGSTVAPREGAAAAAARPTITVRGRSISGTTPSPGPDGQSDGSTTGRARRRSEADLSKDAGDVGVALAGSRASSPHMLAREAGAGASAVADSLRQPAVPPVGSPSRRRPGSR